MHIQLKKLSFVSAGNVFNAILGFAFLSAVARHLSIEDFGKYALLTTLLVAVARITDLGTNSYYVATSITAKEDLKGVFISLKVFLFLLALGISFVALLLLGLASFTILSIFIIGLCAYTLNLTIFAFFQKEELFHFAVGLNTLPAVTKGVMAVLVLLNVLPLNLNIAFLVFSFSVLTSLPLFKYLPTEFKTFEWDTKRIGKLFIKALPAGIAILINESWAAIANTIAKLAKSFADVGILSAADKVASIFSLISLSIFTVLLPKNAKRKAAKENYDINETILISVAILLMAGMATILGKWLIPILFGAKYLPSIPILGILIFASAFTAIHSFIENYFFIENRTVAIMNVNLVKLCIFILLAFVLIPIYELWGLAVAELLGALAALIVTIYLLKKT